MGKVTHLTIILSMTSLNTSELVPYCSSKRFGSFFHDNIQAEVELVLQSDSQETSLCGFDSFEGD